ncbi:MAG: hypothetical protein AB7F35_07665 [Acetobacteraceae bacterium]
MELPALGYPPTEEAVTDWFVRTYGRPPNEGETGAILDAMARRDSTPPQTGPVADPRGWSAGDAGKSR